MTTAVTPQHGTDIATADTTAAPPEAATPVAPARRSRRRIGRGSSDAEPPAGAMPPAPNAERGPRRVRKPLAERLALAALLVATAVMWLWNLSINGYANQFYAAAAQAGSTSWSAFLWGASDAGGSITVDKPPASLWLPSLSIRIFGLNSWSVLVPQVILGVLSVWLVYSTVRRKFSMGGALIAGAVLALTPVATLMFRFNNPDALLVALMAAAAYCTLRAVENGKTRWIVLAGVALGFGFLTKQLQAFLILPGLGVAYLWAAPISIGKRIRDALLAVGALIVSAGWWVLLTVLVPSGSRPYIGGSQNDSFLQLTFGYNGFGRLTGDETGSVGGQGGGTGGGQWGATGIGRLFTSEFAGQFSWLAPAAAILLVAGLIVTRKAKRTDSRRAAFVVWGSWLVVTWLVFSFMAGIFHQYYTVALVPAIAALVGMGVSVLWERREKWWAIATLAATSVVTGVWSFVLLNRSASFVPWLRYGVLAGAIVGAVLLIAARLVAGVRPTVDLSRVRGLFAAGAGIAILAGLAGPAAYSIDTINTSEQGSIVSAGPAVSGSNGMGGGPGGQGGGQMPQGMQNGPSTQNGQGGPGANSNSQGQMPNGQAPGSNSNSQPNGAAGGQPPSMPNNGSPNGNSNGNSTSTNGQAQGQTGTQSQIQGGPGGTADGGGGMGGLLGGTSVSSELTALLEKNASRYTWVAATVGSQNAASYQLATQESVMSIGGFNGSDPSPTLAQFKKYVAEGKIHYFIGSGTVGAGQGGSNSGSEIAQWVASNFTAKTVGNTTVYDLTSATTTS